MKTLLYRHKKNLLSMNRWVHSCIGFIDFSVCSKAVKMCIKFYVVWAVYNILYANKILVFTQWTTYDDFLTIVLELVTALLDLIFRRIVKITTFQRILIRNVQQCANFSRTLSGCIAHLIKILTNCPGIMFAFIPIVLKIMSALLAPYS